MHQNIFNFIEESYATFKTLLPEILEARKTLHIDFINEYIHLLSNLYFDFENLYAHDEEQPELNTLKQDFFKLMSSTLKFKNYCFMIHFEGNRNKPLNDIFKLIDDIKTNYYYYLKNNVFEYEEY